MPQRNHGASYLQAAASRHRKGLAFGVYACAASGAKVELNTQSAKSAPGHNLAFDA